MSVLHQCYHNKQLFAYYSIIRSLPRVSLATMAATVVLVDKDLASEVAILVEAEDSAVVCPSAAAVVAVMVAPSLVAVTRLPATHPLLWPLLEAAAAASHRVEAVVSPTSTMATAVSSMWPPLHLSLAFPPTSLLPLHPSHHPPPRLPHQPTTAATTRFASSKEAAVAARD